jgi:hypothetical protein
MEHTEGQSPDRRESEDASPRIEVARSADAMAIARIYVETALDTYPNERAGITREDIERRFGRVATKKRKLYNGRIRCDLYQYYGPLPPGRRSEV